MISFYPGPSRVYDNIPRFVDDAYNQGILSMNHRSDEFMLLCKNTITLIKEKLDVPSSYSVFFASSATECWEIIAQSLIREKSTHIYNGAFGEKWYTYTKRLRPQAENIYFNPAASLDTSSLKNLQTEVICLTQNETSNGTQLSRRSISIIKKENPKAIIAVDATSSMAGIYLDFKTADVWFASVQKCFGLPAGLAVIICSPRALQQAQSIHEVSHYNSLMFINEMMDKCQTPCTPNVLGIYLLMRVLKKRKPIGFVDHKIKNRSHVWKKFIRKSTNLKLYINNQDVLSDTVLALTGKPELIAEIKKKAKAKGLILGDGYGSLKNATFRIANFPAIKKMEIEKLQKFLKGFL